MAGIGFELAKLLKQGNYRSLIRAFGLTAFIGAGPGVFVILSLGIICFFTLFSTPNSRISSEFLTIVIYLLSTSMIISAFFQYTFFRFVADKVFSEEFTLIMPNFNGVLLVQILCSMCFSLPVLGYFFSEYSIFLKILLLANQVILCLIWLTTVLLTGLKSFRFIVWGFGLGYGAMILLHFGMAINTLDMLLFEFLIAQIIVFLFIFHAVIDYYPTAVLIRFDFLRKENLYYSLILANFFYTFGFWIDKYLFWFNHNTGITVLPPLYSSPVYDVPMFVASLTSIPAMTSFILYMESQFGLIFPKLMETIFKHKSLSDIVRVRDELIHSAQSALYHLFKTQAGLVIVCCLSASFIFEVFHVTSLSLHLLFVLLIGVALQIILWALLSLLYYLTQYKAALWVSFLFFVSNLCFTQASLIAGPEYYGYGYCLSLLISISCALWSLNKGFQDLLYFIFMMTE